jgi:hypothetical protein
MNIAGTYLGNMYASDYWPPLKQADHILPDVNRTLGGAPASLVKTKRLPPRKIGSRVAGVVRFG